MKLQKESAAVSVTVVLSYTACKSKPVRHHRSGYVAPCPQRSMNSIVVLCRTSHIILYAPTYL